MRDRFFELLEQEPSTPRLAIWSLSTASGVDLAGIEMLLHLHRELRSRGIELRLADARGPVREDLRGAGLEASFGTIDANRSVASVVREWQART